jgi:serine/threonine-protein kinase
LRTDLFSLGAVAYFLLTGTCAFDGDNARAIMYARVKGTLSPPSVHRPDIPKDLEQIVIQCLAREKSARFADAKALQQALGRCACAGEWTDEYAASWWETNADLSVHPIQDSQSTWNYSPSTK